MSFDPYHTLSFRTCLLMRLKAYCKVRVHSQRAKVQKGLQRLGYMKLDTEYIKKKKNTRREVVKATNVILSSIKLLNT